MDEGGWSAALPSARGWAGGSCERQREKNVSVHAMLYICLTLFYRWLPCVLTPAVGMSRKVHCTLVACLRSLLLTSGVFRDSVARHVAIFLAATHLNVADALYSDVELFGGHLRSEFRPLVDFVRTKSVEDVVRAAIGVSYLYSAPHEQVFDRNANVAENLRQKRHIPLAVAVQYVINYLNGDGSKKITVAVDDKTPAYLFDSVSCVFFFFFFLSF